MSLYSIKQYHDKKEKIKHFSGSKNETTIRNAVYILLNDYAKTKHLEMVTEVSLKANNSKKIITPDGTLKDILRQDYGYWESKDEKDSLDDEIKIKFSKGYPTDNILFEDSQTAVLIQNAIEVMRVDMQDSQALHKLLTEFINFERPEVKEFRQAIEYFKQDIPKVTYTLREIIKQAEIENTEYLKLSQLFLKLCHESINPNVTKEDVREMMIQHILTENIFNRIFGEDQFHRENTIARELENVIHTFFTGDLRRAVLDNIQHYYNTINARAASIPNHYEKQKFLKVIYEVFYQSYNPKAADRLGVVYTPNEIVRFMNESTDYLLHIHFNKFLEDEGVDILDPATGTGTFICDLIEHISKKKLDYKYRNELHANEVAILPYYISNLNIEFTYKQRMDKSCEFKHLCFVDTLDNMGFSYKGKQTDIVTSLTEENTLRIKNQNNKKISVVIGNPPYNANQLNENENNKNREYPEIDARIKKTFIAESTAQKTKVYDMYARFYRWAMDRIDDKGIIAFVTNRSFIDSRTFDGFRKCIQTDFDFAYIIDTKSDVRANPKIAGTTHNVFGIQTGVAIMFLVRNAENRAKNAQCVINYFSMQDEWLKGEKLQFFVERHIRNISFTHIQPDKNNNWINLAEVNDWESLFPIADKDVKAGKSGNAIFYFPSLGVSTNRDDWVYDFSEKTLIKKIRFFIKTYNELLKNKDDSWNTSIKWSASLKESFNKNKKLKFNSEILISLTYRPFFKQFYYAEQLLSDRLTQNHYDIFGKTLNKDSKVICFSGQSSSKPFQCLAVNKPVGLDFLEKTQCLALYRYDKYGLKNYNITHTALDLFKKHYQNNEITKEDIFHYVYAVLHNPKYLKKYALNLKRDFPRIPFYENLSQWAEWGKQLMELHLNYETAKPYPLRRQDLKQDKIPQVKLKADKEQGLIFIDDNTTLSEVPSQVWEYKLGNRSALEWILDQYKEKKPKDPTIAEQFNAYRFVDYKEQVIDLLMRVCTVSVETMKIVEMMTLIDTK